MKFFIAVVIVALAAGVQSGVLPYATYLDAPLSYTAVSGPAVLHAAPAAIHVSHTAPFLASPYIASPLIAAPLIAHEPTYVAKTRGAVHVAPLPGHVNSAASINLQPAPGTF